jgi:hypothetical protein
MLPRPPAMATPPSTAIPASWNPAVPPPPVAGAPLGLDPVPWSPDWPEAAPLLLAPEAGALLAPDAGALLAPDAGALLAPDAGALLEPDAGALLEPDPGALLEPDPGALLEPDAGALLEEPVCGLALPLALDEAPPLAAPVALELPDPLTVGESTVTGGLLEVQAESATQASMVVRPQPATVSRTRCDVHAMAVRALIEPPCGPGNDHFPVARGRNRGKRRRP